MVPTAVLSLFLGAISFADAAPFSFWHKKPKAPANTGPFPASLQKYLKYGPEFGVDHKTISTHEKNFDDTAYLGIPGNKNNYRTLSTFKCWHLHDSDSGYLMAEMAVYAHDNNNKVTTNYHGFK